MEVIITWCGAGGFAWHPRVVRKGWNFVANLVDVVDGHLKWGTFALHVFAYVRNTRQITTSFYFPVGRSVGQRDHAAVCVCVGRAADRARPSGEGQVQTDVRTNGWTDEHVHNEIQKIKKKEENYAGN